MADLSKIKLNGTEYDLKDAIARNLLHIINIELTGDTYNNLPTGQLNCSQEELKNYYKNGLCIFRLKKDENTYTYFQISDYDSTLSQIYSNYFSETLDVYTIYGTITLNIDGGFFADAGMIGVKSDGTCFISSSRHLIPYITDHSSKGIYDLVTGELDISNIVMNSDLSTVATSGNYNDLTHKPNIPEAETDANVEDMLDDFNLDYTSNTTNSNYANGVNF